MKLQTRHHTPRVRSARDPERLLARHEQELAALFHEFGAAAGDTRRRAIAERLCHLVDAQCEIEDEILYPEARRVVGRPDNRLRAAQLEGAFVRKVVAQIRSLPQGDGRLAATLDILRGYLADYAEQQRADVLPRLRRAGPRIPDLCAAMLSRRAQLLGGVGATLS